MSDAAHNISAKPAVVADFNWEDPLDLEGQLTEEERMIRDSVRDFAEDKLASRVKGIDVILTAHTHDALPEPVMVDKTKGEAAMDEMVNLIHNYVYTDRPIEKAAPSIIAGSMRINQGAALNTTSVADQLEWFQSEGLVDASITMADLVDGSYVETA